MSARSHQQFAQDQDPIVALDNLERIGHVHRARHTRKVTLHLWVASQRVLKVLFLLGQRLRLIWNLVTLDHAKAKNMRIGTGFRYEMNLLLASLRRVEVRIEPQSITDFLKWKNRMAEYNRGTLPEGLTAAEEERNVFLEPEAQC